MITNGLIVAVCKDSSDAIHKGYFYRKPVYQPLRLDTAVVVKNGTQAGNSTVDLVMVDEHGQKYVVLISSKLLATIPAFGPDHEQP